MSESRVFVPYETIDYVATINKALQRVFEARASIRGTDYAFSFERYLRAVEALITILLPRLRPRDAARLLEEARKRRAVKILDELVSQVIDALDRNRLLIRGEVYEEERL